MGMGTPNNQSRPPRAISTSSCMWTHQRLSPPLKVPKMPLAEPLARLPGASALCPSCRYRRAPRNAGGRLSPPRDSRFGSPLKMSRVHWVRPQVVVEVTYLTWTEDNLLRQVSYQAQREDKLATQVVRPVPHPLPRARLRSKTSGTE